MKMNYKDYIDLGFKRVDANDSVDFEITGYSGFYLYFKLKKGLEINVYWTEINKPTLHIPKNQEGHIHRVDLTVEQMKDLINCFKKNERVVLA